MHVVVQRGDTLWGIAQRYGVSLDALIRANPQIRNPNLIYAGQSVNLPGWDGGDGFEAAPEAPAEAPEMESPPPPPPSSPLVDVATDVMNRPWAYNNINQPGDHTWDLWCLGFVNQVAQMANGHRDPVLMQPSAKAAYHSALANGRINGDLASMPPGAVVFWPSGRFGHVAIYSGRNNPWGDPIFISTTGWGGRSGIRELTLSTLNRELGPAAGWMMPR